MKHRGDVLGARPYELVIADKPGALHVVRLTLGLLVVTAALTIHGLTKDGATLLVPVTAVYLVVVAGMELLRRMGSVHRVPVAGVLLALDGVWLAAAREWTGGPLGVLAPLVVVHLVAVTLLASSRTGLHVALWHAALYLGSYAAALTAGRDPRSIALELTTAESSVLAVLGFLVVAIATAACSAVNEADLRRGKAAVQSLADLAASLEHVRRPGEVAEAAVRLSVEALGYARGALLAVHDDVATLHVASADGGVRRAERARPVDGIVHRAWTTGEPVLAARLDPNDNPTLAPVLPGATNLLVLPLLDDDAPVGALVLERGGPAGGRVTRRTVGLAGQFARHISLSLRNAWLLAEVERLATTDQLTGLANRRVFEQALRRETKRAQRNDGSVALVLVDADHFKKVNDEHGHQVGDEVLRALGRVLRRITRDVDVAARFGGEELAVILPGADARRAMALAERIRAAVARCDAPVPVTVSLGVAAVPEHAADPQALLRAADEALYASKHAGRNRVTLASH